LSDHEEVLEKAVQLKVGLALDPHVPEFEQLLENFRGRHVLTVSAHRPRHQNRPALITAMKEKE